MRQCHRIWLGSKASNTVQQNAGRTAVVLVVVEDALADFGFALSAPAVKPLDGRRTRGMGVAPSEAEIFGERLDGVIPRRPFRRLAHHVAVKIDRARRLEEPLHVLGGADVGIFLLEPPINSTLVF